jgi:hypothetical protein
MPDLTELVYSLGFESDERKFRRERLADITLGARLGVVEIAAGGLLVADRLQSWYSAELAERRCQSAEVEI